MQHSTFYMHLDKVETSKVPPGLEKPLTTPVVPPVSATYASSLNPISSKSLVETFNVKENKHFGEIY